MLARQRYATSTKVGDVQCSPFMLYSRCDRLPCIWTDAQCCGMLPAAAVVSQRSVQCISLGFDSIRLQQRQARIIAPANSEDFPHLWYDNVGYRKCESDCNNASTGAGHYETESGARNDAEFCEGGPNHMQSLSLGGPRGIYCHTYCYHCMASFSISIRVPADFRRHGHCIAVGTASIDDHNPATTVHWGTHILE